MGAWQWVRHAPRYLAPAPRARISAIQHHRSLLRAQNPAYQAQQGGFAGAVWPQQSDHLPGAHLEMYIIEQGLAMITKGDALHI